MNSKAEHVNLKSHSIDNNHFSTFPASAVPPTGKIFEAEFGPLVIKHFLRVRFQL